MKRFHVHVHVENLAASVGFYSKLFAATPTRLESDYAKWMIDDPRINFAISTRGAQPGVDHLGFQTDDAEELAELKGRAKAADLALLDDGETTCCYARSEKHWITDPQGVAWEHFHTLENIPVFSEAKAGASMETACCASQAGAPALGKTDGATESRAAASPQAAARGAPAAGAAATGTAAASRGKPIGISVKSAGSCC